MKCNLRNFLKKAVLIFMAPTIWAVAASTIMSAQTSGTGTDGYTRVLWQGPDSSIVIWELDSGLNFVTGVTDGPVAGWTPIGLSVGDDNYTRIIWRSTAGELAVWLLDPSLNLVGGNVGGPYFGWLPVSESLDAAGNLTVIWRYTLGDMAVWVYNPGVTQLLLDKVLANPTYIPGQEGAAVKPRDSINPEKTVPFGNAVPLTRALPDELTPHFKPLTHLPQLTNK